MRSDTQFPRSTSAPPPDDACAADDLDLLKGSAAQQHGPAGVGGGADAGGGTPPTATPIVASSTVVAAFVLAFLSSIDDAVVLPSLWAYLQQLGGGEGDYGRCTLGYYSARVVAMPFVGAWCDRRPLKEVRARAARPLSRDAGRCPRPRPFSRRTPRVEGRERPHHRRKQASRISFVFPRPCIATWRRTINRSAARLSCTVASAAPRDVTARASQVFCALLWLGAAGGLLYVLAPGLGGSPTVLVARVVLGLASSYSMAAQARGWASWRLSLLSNEDKDRLLSEQLKITDIDRPRS